MMKFRVLIAALAVVLAAMAHASAGGGIGDPLDRECVAARDHFAAYKRTVSASLDDLSAKAQAGILPDGYEKVWRDSKYEQLRSYFDETVVPEMRSDGAGEVNYDKWFNNRLSKLSPEELNTLLLESYRQDVAIDRELADEDIADQQKELGKMCKKDVGSQVVRGATKIFLSQITRIAGNIERAKKHVGDGVVSQAIELTTGINGKHIFTKGPAGGDKSIVRQSGRAADKHVVQPVKKALGL